MFPLRDTTQSERLPLVSWALILINAVVFLIEISLGPQRLAAFIQNWGLIPANLDLFQPLSWLPLFTNIFLHAGWFHILSNMWTLFIFGDNVEDRMGHGRYLIFYLLSGLAANLIQVITAPGSSVPTIGASGAIAGVLGAYFYLFPQARVLTFIPLGFLPWLIQVPAVLYLGFWFITQFFSGLAALGMPAYANMGGVAWWAHIGGFVFGLALVRLFARRVIRYEYDIFPPPRSPHDPWR